jgi:hypothetical protein
VDRAVYLSGADHPTIRSSNLWTSEEGEWKEQNAWRLWREQAFKFGMAIASSCGWSGAQWSPAQYFCGAMIIIGQDMCGYVRYGLKLNREILPT